jgi:hypothetical protein
MATVFDPDAYCSDEDIVKVARSNFAAIASDDEELAKGTDGTFDAMAPWDLASATVNFQAQGVVAGNIVILGGRHTQPQSTTVTKLGVSGQNLVVSAVAGPVATLRRVGLADGVGQAPGTGGVSGVTFRCCTFGPQIQRATREIRRELAFDAPAETLIDADDLNELCVLWVLADLFHSKIRLGSASGQVAAGVPFGGDYFALNYNIYAKERDAKLAELQGRRVAMDATDSVGVVPIDPPRPWATHRSNL